MIDAGETLAQQQELQQKLTDLQQQINDQNLELANRQELIIELSAVPKEEDMATHNHESRKPTRQIGK